MTTLAGWSRTTDTGYEELADAAETVADILSAPTVFDLTPIVRAWLEAELDALEVELADRLDGVAT